MSKTTTSKLEENRDVPDFTLRKKYTKRPSHVIKMKFLKEPSKDLKLPEDDTRRMWSLVDSTHVVVKTWHFEPLPAVADVLSGCEFESISVEFNLGPHENDVNTLREMSLLKCDQFSLEFREHWAGLYPKNIKEEMEEQKGYRQIPKEQNKVNINNDKNENCKTDQANNELISHEQNEGTSTNDSNNSYSDLYLKPFLEKEFLRVKLRILTGRISSKVIKELPFLYNLKFLGLRMNYEEYITFVETVPYFQSLERVHLLPQWTHNAELVIPPIKFLGVVTIYYWDLDTTKVVKKSYQKWKKSQTKRKLFCL